ncbi:MAG TPA: fibronectin type III domain-containing protein [Bdellovibrionota bacterium]|nr:fibronectin type III domain-containing protein [Bdellovibrionota bacterium]
MSLSAVSIDPSTNKGSITLGWNAPTTNTDGTAVDDLAGYRVRIGTSSGTYATTVDVGATTTTTIPNLISGQTYYFVVSAINTSGAESNASAEVSKVAP